MSHQWLMAGDSGGWLTVTLEVTQAILGSRSNNNNNNNNNNKDKSNSNRYRACRRPISEAMRMYAKPWRLRRNAMVDAADEKLHNTMHINC